MNSNPLTSEIEYRESLKRLEVIFDASIGSKEGDEAELLSSLIEKYENEHYPIDSTNQDFQNNISSE